MEELKTKVKARFEQKEEEIEGIKARAKEILEQKMTAIEELEKQVEQGNQKVQELE